MKPDIHISNYQMLTLLVMHSLGSSTLFALGGRAKTGCLDCRSTRSCIGICYFMATH